MKKENKNKGFSLIEVLAAVVIMGILSTIAIVSVNFILEKAEKEYYKSQEDEIINAAKSYAQDNRNFLPKRVGMKKYITLKELQNKKYIGKIKDRHKKECDYENTVVQVFKYDKEHYSYSINLVCDNYETGKTESAKNDSKITIKFNETEKYKDQVFSITMKDEDKIASYSYIIYRNGVEEKNSGDIEGKLKTEITTKDISLASYLPGKIKIKVIVIDLYGNQTTSSSEKNISNANAPTCEIINENKTWTNTVPLETSVKCISKTGIGCERDIYSTLYSDSTKIANIDMKDKEGNAGVCKVNVYLDVDPPSKPVISNQYDNKWTNKDYTIKISSKDEHSGIAYFEYRYPNSSQTAKDGTPENQWHRWDNSSREAGDSTPFETTKFSTERDEIVEVRACDKAGNCSEAATTKIRIDKTKPTVISVNNPYANTWFNKALYDANNNAYVITITTKDNLSGISYHQYKYPNSTNTWEEYDNSGNTNESTNKNEFVFKTTPFKTDRDEKVLFKVCDRAGNCVETDSYIKIDKTLPTIKVTNPYANTWVNKEFSVTATATDKTSGVGTIQSKYSDESSWTSKYSSTTKVTSKTVTEGPFKTDTNKSLSFKVCDIAGNCQESSATMVKVDMTPPSCTITANKSPDGNNGWYVTPPTLTLNRSDTGSGIAAFDFTTSTTPSYNFVSSRTLANSDMKPTTYYGYVKDNAGNTATCKSSVIKIDVTKPTITIS